VSRDTQVHLSPYVCWFNFHSYFVFEIVLKCTSHNLLTTSFMYAISWHQIDSASHNTKLKLHSSLFQTRSFCPGRNICHTLFPALQDLHFLYLNFTSLGLLCSSYNICLSFPRLFILQPLRSQKFKKFPIPEFYFVLTTRI
jgi:hypothetical protein